MLTLSVWTLASFALAADIKVTDAEGERLHVYVNGDEKGKTPMTVRLPEGQHTVSVKEVPYLAAELEYVIDVTDESAKGDLEFSWEYERAKFAWGGGDMLVVMGEAAAGEEGASGVRAGHQSSSSVDRVAGSGGSSSSSSSSGGSSSSSSSSSSSGGSSSSSSSSSSSGGSTSSSDGGSSASSSSGGSTSSSDGGSSSGGSTSSDGGSTSSDGGSSSGGSTSSDGGSATADGGSSSGGSTSSDGGSSSGGSTSSDGGSSSGGSSSGGSTGGSDGVAAIDPGSFNPAAAPVKITVPAFYPDFAISLRSASGEVGADFGGEELELPEGPNEVTVILGDQDLSYPVFVTDGATLPLPWGMEIDDGEGGIQRFLYGPEDAPPEEEFRVTLPEPIDYPVQVKAYLSPTPGVLQRYEIDPMLHPAFSAYDDLEATIPGKEKANKIMGGLLGAGLGVAAMGAGTWWYANQVNQQALQTTDPQEFQALSDRAELLLLAGNGLGFTGVAVGLSGIIYRATGGKKYHDAYNEAERTYKEAKRETVPLDSIAE